MAKATSITAPIGGPAKRTARTAAADAEPKASAKRDPGGPDIESSRLKPSQGILLAVTLGAGLWLALGALWFAL